MKYTLQIDTTKVGEATISLIDEQRNKTSVHHEATFIKSQMVLPLFEQILDECKAQIGDISAIEVLPGPGSFTGLRVGAIIGMTLSLLLSVPINGQPPGTLPTLHYGEDKWHLTQDH